ncbi:MAG: HAD family phosphatase [Deltaproteobacteria bacterium]|nr:HAD family phosphatase [Deltaproteobacteria bacterium]
MNNLKYPLVCFDLDGTLVDDTIYIWKTLHEGFNTDAYARKQAMDDYFNNKITYKEWFDHDLILLHKAGATKSAMKQMFNSLSIMPGAIKTLKALKLKGHKLAIISGSLDIVVNHLFPEDLFDYMLINKIYFDAKGQILNGIHTPYDIEKKADGLKYLCEKEGISTKEAVFVGDNENDLWIAKEAGLSIAFNCKSKKLSEISHIEIKQKDMTQILPHIS